MFILPCSISTEELVALHDLLVITLPPAHTL